MGNPFFERPILNSPYEYPARHWELDDSGQPTQKIIETRRRAEFITPIPKPKKQKGAPKQANLLFDEGKGLSTEAQAYDHTAIINGVRQLDVAFDEDRSRARRAHSAANLVVPRHKAFNLLEQDTFIHLGIKNKGNKAG